MKKVLDFDQEHFPVCKVCSNMFIIKSLIISFDFSTDNLHEIRDFVDGLINGDVYD